LETKNISVTKVFQNIIDELVFFSVPKYIVSNFIFSICIIVTCKLPMTFSKDRSLSLSVCVCDPWMLKVRYTIISTQIWVRYW